MIAAMWVLVILTVGSGASFVDTSLKFYSKAECEEAGQLVVGMAHPVNPLVEPMARYTCLKQSR